LFGVPENTVKWTECNDVKYNSSDI